MANVALHNKFGLLEQIESTLSQLLDLIRAKPKESPTQLKQSSSPAIGINDHSFGWNSMDASTEGPTLPVISKLPSPYKDALTRRAIIPSALILFSKASYWKKRGEMSTGDYQNARSLRIRQKIESLRASSSPLHPVCFRCGDKGHLAPDCRNAVLCFLCNRLGHKARWCRSDIDLPIPMKHKPPSASPKTLGAPSSLPPCPLNSSSVEMHRHIPINAPVAHFFSTPDSEAFEQHFRQSFFLDDPFYWEAEKIEGILRNHPHMRQYAWKMRIFEDMFYLIEALNSRWLDQTMENGFIHLKNKDFPVSAWDPGSLRV